MSCFGTSSQPLTGQPDFKENLNCLCWLNFKFLLAGHQKLGKKLPNLQIHGFNQSFLLFLTMAMSLSNCNETRYIKKISFFFPLEFIVLRTFFPMNLSRTITETILYMKVKLICIPSLPGPQRGGYHDQKKM